jgi:hypothetical protein
MKIKAMVEPRPGNTGCYELWVKDTRKDFYRFKKYFLPNELDEIMSDERYEIQLKV